MKRTYVDADRSKVSKNEDGTYNVKYGKETYENLEEDLEYEFYMPGESSVVNEKFRFFFWVTTILAIIVGVGFFLL